MLPVPAHHGDLPLGAGEPAAGPVPALRALLLALQPTAEPLFPGDQAPRVGLRVDAAGRAVVSGHLTGVHVNAGHRAVVGALRRRDGKAHRAVPLAVCALEHGPDRPAVRPGVAAAAAKRQPAASLGQPDPAVDDADVVRQRQAVTAPAAPEARRADLAGRVAKERPPRERLVLQDVPYSGEWIVAEPWRVVPEACERLAQVRIAGCGRVDPQRLCQRVEVVLARQHVVPDESCGPGGRCEIGCIGTLGEEHPERDLAVLEGRFHPGSVYSRSFPDHSSFPSAIQSRACARRP